MSLSILIPTVTGREQSFNALVAELERQAVEYDVEIKTCCDNKEMSIGAKRQLLLESATKTHCVFIDDDDSVPADYIATVWPQLTFDGIGYIEQITGGKKAAHSQDYDGWYSNRDGYDYVRCLFCKDVIRTSIALQVGFADIRYGEDYDFSIRLLKSGLIRTHTFVPKVMYHYSMPQLNSQQFKARYGI